MEYDQTDYSILLYSTYTRSTYQSLGITPYPWSLRLRGFIQLSRIGNVLQNMINPRISAVWITTKLISPFSCTRRVQEVHTKGQVVHLTRGLLGLRVLFNCHA